MFSWPVISPFAILHVDEWMSGHYTDSNGCMTLMNVMCDTCQFVVVVPVPDKISTTLASYFMQYVLLEFSLCHLVVIDGGNPFKEAFIAMCEALNLSHDVIVKHNHKGLSIEHFQRFLNKSIAIAAEERGTNDTFVLAGVATGYALNISPIDGTDILRSISAIGRELYFPLDISLNALPKLIQNNGQAVLDYLILTDSSRHFSNSILKSSLRIVVLLMQNALSITGISLFVTQGISS